MIDKKFTTISGECQKQQIREINLKYLKHFLCLNRGSDVIISTLPSKEWIVEKEIAALSIECNFKNRITCLFYERLSGRHGSEFNKFTSIIKTWPSNINSYYINSMMPNPSTLDAAFNCPIFFWGDFCCEYNNSLIESNINCKLNLNSIVFFTFAFKNNFASLESQTLIKESEALVSSINDLLYKNSCINTKKTTPNHKTCFIKYRSKKFNMVFWGYDNFDCKNGNNKIYSMYHNMENIYPRNWTVPQLMVLFRKSEQEILNIVL